MNPHRDRHRPPAGPYNIWDDVTLIALATLLIVLLAAWAVGMRITHPPILDLMEQYFH